MPWKQTSPGPRARVRHPRVVLVLAGASLGVGLAACGGGGSTSPTSTGGGSTSPTSTGGGANTIVIQGFAFHPATLTVAAGATVTVKNEDSTDHTVTAENKAFD